MQVLISPRGWPKTWTSWHKPQPRPFTRWIRSTGSGSQVVRAIEQAMEGETQPWTALVQTEDALKERLCEQGIEDPEAYSTIQWDPAMLLFTTCIELNPDGRPLQLGETLTRERFGRFPFGDGSALGYLLEYIRPNRSITEHDGQSTYDELIDHLQRLTHGCEEQHRGHSRFEDGFGGMQIRGFLSAEEVRDLARNWRLAVDRLL